MELKDYPFGVGDTDWSLLSNCTKYGQLLIDKFNNMTDRSSHAVRCHRRILDCASERILCRVGHMSRIGQLQTWRPPVSSDLRLRLDLPQLRHPTSTNFFDCCVKKYLVLFN